MCLSLIFILPYDSWTSDPLFRSQVYDPNLIVPPLFLIFFCFSIKSIIGKEVFLSNSVELAPLFPNTFLENSIHAHCIPKHIPKKGILFSLTYLIEDILPSIPLSPNPGATITPSIFFN